MKIYFQISLVLTLFISSLYSQELKPFSSSDDLEGLWEVYKVDPPATGSVVGDWLGKKISITKQKIIILDEFESYNKMNYTAKECELTKGSFKTTTLQKYSKFSSLSGLNKDDKINLGIYFCANTPFSEFIYHPKMDSIIFNSSTDSSNFIYSKRISRTPIQLSAPKVGEFIPSNFYMTDKAVDAIKQLESYRDHVYLDGNGNNIFGYGHLVTPNELTPLKEKFGFRHTDVLTGQSYNQAPTTEPTDSEKRDAVDYYLRKDLEIIVNNMKKNITVALPQHKIDAILIYLFWRGSYADNLQVKEFYQLVNARDEQAVTNFMLTRMKRDSSGRDIPFLGGHYIRHRNTVRLYNEAKYADNWLIDSK
jgi:GH24 family phage-related lysozyme (muramidase)